jgi:hypothetical protein
MYSILIGILASVSFVYAQEETLIIPQKREEIKQKIEEKKSILQTQIVQKREEVKEQINSFPKEQKTKLQILAQERVLKAVTHIFEQFEATIVKFDGIILRVENRIAKLENEGVDATKTKELLEVSRVKLQETTALVAANKLELGALIATEISKDQIKTSVTLCKESLKEVKMSLIEVIDSLKLLGDVSSDSIFIE